MPGRHHDACLLSFFGLIQVEGVPEEVIFDHLHATAFQYSPLGRTILGPADNIRALTRDDLAQYIATHYTAPRMVSATGLLGMFQLVKVETLNDYVYMQVVAGAGAIEHDDLVNLASKQFASLSTDPTTASDLVAKEPSIFTGSDVRIREPDAPTVNLAVAFKGASWTDPDSIPLMVIQTLLGGWTKDSTNGESGEMGASDCTYWL